MSPVKTTVTPISQESRNPLPSYLSRYVMLMGWLREWGLLSKISDHLRLPRNKGFQGIDLFMTVLAFFCGARWDGLHRFADETLRWGAQLAGIGGRARWPTQASLSRLMSSVSIEQARRFANFLLQDSLDLSPLLHHDSVLHIDGKGDGWHVFDFDPTSTVMRQRALPSDPDLPQANRLSDGLAAPGYTGRKRGETKISRPCLQHRGARLWLSVDQKPGNGEWAADVAQATQSVECVAERHRLELNRCIVCTDGEQGGHTQTRIGLASSVHFVTRLAVYILLQTEHALANLDQATWERVEDSGSGPTRWASEFGNLDADEGEARLVVTRFRNEENKRGAGIVIDGWQYEIFSTDLCAEAFSAADLVTLYYGRCGQENYFALEDRELGLDHVFSYTPGGQLVCIAIGLWMANAEIVLGWQLQDPPAGRPDSPQVRQVEIQPGRNWSIPEIPIESVPEPEPVTDPQAPPANLAEWSPKLTPGFRWDADHRNPICPAGHAMQLHARRSRTRSRIELRYRTSPRHCQTCPLRSQCTDSTSASFRKEISVRVEPEVAKALNVSLRPKVTIIPQVPQTIRQWKPLHRVEPGPWAHRGPVLAPRQLRRAFHDLSTQLQVAIHAAPIPTRPTPSKLFYRDAAHRQRRRRSWQQRVAWNERPENATVSISIIAPPDLQRILVTTRSPAVDAAGG